MNGSVNRVFIAALFFVVTSCARIFHTEVSNYNSELHGFEDNLTHYLRETPITVREYFIFLSWSIDVYGESFSEYVQSLFPNACATSKDVQNKDYSSLFECLTEKNAANFLNPAYLDFPMSGLTKYQLTELYKWLTDRYNENMLVEIGYFTFNPAQRDEDSYSLEADICNYFLGDISDAKKKPYWSDGVYVPLFRPPYEEESPPTQNTIYKNKISPVWREYKMDKSHFLNRWNKHYLELDEDYLVLKVPVPIRLKRSDTTLKPIEIRQPFSLMNRRKNLQMASYIEDQEKSDKNEHGKMGFFIVGQNGYGRPIVVDTVVYNSIGSSQSCVYWVVYDKVLKYEYWP